MQPQMLMMTIAPQFVEVMPGNFIDVSKISKFVINEQRQNMADPNSELFWCLTIYFAWEVHPQHMIRVDSRDAGLKLLGIVRQSPLAIK
jgi:hypothetical protein